MHGGVADHASASPRVLSRLGGSRANASRRGTALAGLGGWSGLRPGWGGRLWAGTPCWCRFWSAACHAVSPGAGRYKAPPTGRGTGALTNRHTTRPCPFRDPPVA